MCAGGDGDIAGAYSAPSLMQHDARLCGGCSAEFGRGGHFPLPAHTFCCSRRVASYGLAAFER